MSESRDDKDLPQGMRRKLLKASALTLAGAGLYGVAPFYGPWKQTAPGRRAHRRSPW